MSTTKLYSIAKKVCIIFLLFIAPCAYASSDLELQESRISAARNIMDKREVKNPFSPSSLDAVGKLSHKVRANRRSKVTIDCTANLIAPIANIESNIVITARHCLSSEIKLYKWTSTAEGRKVSRIAKVVYKDRHNDWALLKLNKPVSHEVIKPLIVSEETFEEGDLICPDKEDYLVAGFSVDSLGGFGTTLTYQENPDFIDFAEEDELIGQVGALTHQGDSGGAVIYQSDDENYLVGLMSFISRDENTFESEKGTFGNLSGYFIDLINYEAIHAVLSRYFKRQRSLFAQPSSSSMYPSAATLG